MIRETPDPGRVDPPAGGEVDSALGELEGVLSGQLDLLSRDSFDGMERLCDRADELLQKIVDNIDRLDGDACGRLENIYALHERVALTAAQRKQQLAEQLCKIRKGKNLVRTYGQNGRQ